MNGEREILEAADAVIIAAMREQLEKQGHHLTGALEASIRGEISGGGGTYTLEGYANSYGGILDAGTTPERIPYSGRTGAGGTSAFIQALKGYWIQRGLGEAEALRAAFATANVQMKEGMSTIASGRFSSTGQRQHFIDAVAEEAGPRIDEVVLAGYDQLVDEVFQETGTEII